VRRTYRKYIVCISEKARPGNQKNLSMKYPNELVIRLGSVYEVGEQWTYENLAVSIA